MVHLLIDATGHHEVDWLRPALPAHVAEASGEGRSEEDVIGLVGPRNPPDAAVGQVVVVIDGTVQELQLWLAEFSLSDLVGNDSIFPSESFQFDPVSRRSCFTNVNVALEKISSLLVLI